MIVIQRFTFTYNDTVRTLYKGRVLLLMIVIQRFTFNYNATVRTLYKGRVLQPAEGGKTRVGVT